MIKDSNRSSLKIQTQRGEKGQKWQKCTRFMPKLNTFGN